MEDSKQDYHSEKEDGDELPSLIKAINENELFGFDSDKEHNDVNGRLKSTGLPPLSPKVFVSKKFCRLIYVDEIAYNRFSLNQKSQKFEAAKSMELQEDLSQSEMMQTVSISMPTSPVRDHIHKTKRVLFKEDNSLFGYEIPRFPTYKKFVRKEKQAKSYSQPIPQGSALNKAIVRGTFTNLPVQKPRNHKLKDGRYDSFKTWSGKLERQISNLRGKHRETDHIPQTQKPAEVENLSVDRYFDALEGPELDKLRASEEIILPEDQQWPFLLRFPINSFGICLGVSSQAIMWKALATSPSTKFLHVSPDVNIVLWFISVATVLIVASIYALKVTFYFEAVRREYYHPIRVNFFFAPWTTLLFLALGIPPSISPTLHASLWYVLMTPIFCLELKIYGQWMSGGQRRLSRVANPSNHLSIVGNFVGALLGASMGLKEGPTFFFAVGLAHYTVLFVTLYQRLPTNETLPKELHPVFFLFVATPSVASMAWARLQGSFDYGSKIAYFISLFLYFSLAVRVNFFRGIRFSLAWWAYTFPMTGAAVATIRYSTAVPNLLTKTLAVALCTVATLTVSSLLVTTLIHAFVLGDLFPNDIAIAISDRRPKSSRKWYHRKASGTDINIDKFLKYSDSYGKDIEASMMNPPSSYNKESPENVNSSPEPRPQPWAVQINPPGWLETIQGKAPGHLHPPPGLSPGPPITGLSAMCGSKSRDVPELVRVSDRARLDNYFESDFMFKLGSARTRTSSTEPMPSRVRTE
ncbi:hypothetical protein RD792_005404 [Penstemon davidsonii]|uniref:Uncharacterized protein n=1 Tax=Penstemon davidsonii TaxID=160366 RepID=A0ABR0DK97_9LAMI|nr:hypothetical protein RD792_005404 [Penstemon davidsonii]